VKVIESAIKASIAAAVTVVLVLICVMADCLSKCKIRRRVKKAMAASNALQAQEPLIEKQALEEENEAMEENVKKV